MTKQISIKELRTIEELYEMQRVEEAVWHAPPTPIHQTYTALNHGGILLGAYDKDQMVGFIYSFAGYDGEHPYLCSHMLGILPEYRKAGLGLKLKYKQAEIAQNLGYGMMTWTFDPLESLNAYLNLHKIGAVGVQYKENHYGKLSGKLNHGLPTDRIQIEWRFAEQRLNMPIELDEANILLHADQDGNPIVARLFYDQSSLVTDHWLVGIPTNFQSIKQADVSLAMTWRLRTREVFQKLFAEGFKARDVIRKQTENICFYYFTK
ncbi:MULTISPECIES: GNAT family N-acetyltransferase [Clostridia]|uniref:GNAT family N-acetyltransferase n=1 Tax=Clostridia TaxID=186801 RepID=UPI000EA17942|nr:MULTISPECIES: GNAT family N-acetyltransferase [Clostridia]NBJ68172.1 GNAT family N-acetyltransferase [Roseburia sp. 1XD42-34]RKI81945.1 GNAT family N-acetyltransferase [Clostridium sp. 1xD42-85]